MLPEKKTEIKLKQFFRVFSLSVTFFQHENFIYSLSEYL